MKRLVVLVVLVGCTRSLPPRGQVVLFVDTDAIVASNDKDPKRLSPQVDRARFEILVDGRPLGGSARVFPIDDELVRTQRLSFGIAPVANDAAVAVRVRLYRADRALADEIPAGITLDTTVSLPPVADEGIVELSILLSADDFGRPIGPVPAARGRPPPSRVGTWHGGLHVGCATPPREGEACVAGGSFFFGDPAFRGRTFANDIVDERLVTISPFFLDTREVTVATFRAALPTLAGASAPLARDPKGKTGTDADFCNWTDAPGALEALPVSCVSWETARAFCRAKGGDLPSEAELEYVTSGLGDEHAYPWGDDEADCGGSVWGRGGEGLFSEGSGACRTATTSDSAALPGSGTRDRVESLAHGRERSRAGRSRRERERMDARCLGPPFGAVLGKRSADGRSRQRRRRHRRTRRQAGPGGCLAVHHPHQPCCVSRQTRDDRAAQRDRLPLRAPLSSRGREMRTLAIDLHVLGGRFRLVRQLGEGGMGVVWEVVETATGRRRAIKFLRDEARTLDAEKRFLREAEAANAVHHPCILHVHEVAYDDDGTPAFVMDLLEGESLGARLERERQLSLGQTAAVLRLVVSALRAAHAAGVVHRDLKPDNIFITREQGGVTGVRVLDFGIARLDRPSEKLTVTGTLMGTPVYMSPEQAAGESGLDARTDVWSIGAIVFECLTGSTPVSGENYGQILSRLIKREIQTLSSMVGGLPADVVAAVDAIFVDRSFRSPDLTPLEALLTRHADAQIVPPPTSPSPATSPDAATILASATAVTPRPRSRALPLALLAVGLLLVVGVLAGAAALRARTRDAARTVTGATSARAPASAIPESPAVAASAESERPAPLPSAPLATVVTTSASASASASARRPAAASSVPAPPRVKAAPSRLPGGVAGEVPF